MITDLGIHNFKSFADVTVPCGPLTLLSGMNGMGKSTVLQALLLLRQSYQQGLLPGRGIALNGDLVQVGTGKDALCEWGGDDLIRFQIAFADGSTGRWEFTYDRTADVMKLQGDDAPAAVYDQSLFGPAFHYLQAERIGPRTVFEMSDYTVTQLEQLGTRGEYTAHFLEIYGSRSIASPALAHARSSSQRLSDQVQAWMSEVSPGTRMELLNHPGTNLVSVYWSFAHGRDLSGRYRSTNVGFGLTYTLPLIVALLSARPGHLLLLENPEAHLHPRGQRRMGELIAKAAGAGVQLLVETHSDHVLNGIRLSVRNGDVRPEQVKLHFFYRQEGEGQPQTLFDSPTVDADGRLDFWPKGFFDEWDQSLEELLKPRQR